MKYRIKRKINAYLWVAVGLVSDVEDDARVSGIRRLLQDLGFAGESRGALGNWKGRI